MNQTDSYITRYISKKRIAHFATCDSKGAPTVIPICFVYHSGIVYTPLDKKPKKILPTKLKRVKNILENPFVSLVVDEYNENWKMLSYIMIQGSASLIDHGEEYKNALQMLCEKYNQYREMNLDELGLPVIKIVSNKIISWGNFD